MNYLLIIIGFVLLIVGADFLVDGASGMAKRFQMSNLFIGLTVVAFGTSMPEMMVNIMASVRETSEIALTNIIGSNIINTFVILGVSAVIWPIASQKRSRQFDIPFSVLAGIIIPLLALISLPFSDKFLGITRLGGIVLLLFFSIFMFFTVRNSKTDTTPQEDFKPMKVWKASLYILGGLAGLVGGGQLIVDSAINIAKQLGVSEAIIGLTIVALGTSLPELATSAVAAYKKNTDLALGNVIGSNIFNVFFVLGVSAIIRPLPAYDGLLLDALIAALGSLLVWIFVCTNKNHKILRTEGLLLLVIYGVYLAHLLRM